VWYKNEGTLCVWYKNEGKIVCGTNMKETLCVVQKSREDCVCYKDKGPYHNMAVSDVIHIIRALQA
jgi:hypothetical protein